MRACIFIFFSSNQLPAHLLQRQYELGDALLAAELSQQLIGVHALAVSGLHQLGDDPLHLLLLSHSAEQFIVEDLTHGGKKEFQTEYLSAFFFII